MSILNKLLAAIAIACALACSSAQAASQNYHVTVDTGSLAGQEGYLDFLFLGLANAAPVQAQLSNFSGDFTAQSFAIGQAAGSINTLLAIGNGDAWNEFGQWAKLGGKLSFDVRFNFDGLDGAGTTLSVALLDAGLNYLGTNSDAVTFSLLPGSDAAVSTDDAIATVSAVPEPATWLMLAAGVLLVLSLGRSALPRSSYQS
ncbi:hypothetical protein GTP46_15985 [Duganella sp. FT135W]|uniref:PEP-CTERM sorting domain-containing protein n=1 Tax=Duganella flavida TaxID=2692175 RepID=A0A6L8KBT2_9BURK|nr:NF038129 family PEP-CTERM protein [Duganella flavida]MYM24147.1 hypothetical protein [Duganella flavida]